MTNVKSLGAIVLGASAIFFVLHSSKRNSTAAGDRARGTDLHMSASHSALDAVEAHSARAVEWGERRIAAPDDGQAVAQIQAPTPSEDPFYAQVRSLCLGSFLTETPDVVGWNGYLELLASSSELGAVHEVSDGIQGNFVIPRTGITIDFSITADGYTITSRGSETIGGLGDIDYQASLAFQARDGAVSVIHGVVQFHPTSGQLPGDGLVGYRYETQEHEASVAALLGEFRNGRYWLTTPPPDAGRSVSSGGLGCAYSWLHRLEEAERMHAARRAQPSQH